MTDFLFEKPEQSTGFILWKVTNYWQRQIKKGLEKFDLTHSQFVILANIHWLSLNQQNVTQIEISNHAKIDPMTTSSVLKTLQKKNLISRQEHQTDTRAKSVMLTNLGVEITKKAIKTVETFDQHFFEVLGNDTHLINTKLLQLLDNDFE